MARRRRWVKMILVSAALTFGLLVFALWWRSYRHIDGFLLRLGPESRLVVESDRGRLSLDRSRIGSPQRVGRTGFYTSPVSDLADTIATANRFGIPMSMPSRPEVGFKRDAIAIQRLNYDSTSFTFPHWWLLVVLLLPGARFIEHQPAA